MFPIFNILSTPQGNVVTFSPATEGGCGVKTVKLTAAWMLMWDDRAPNCNRRPGSRLQSLRGEPDNLLLKVTNATDKASTPQARFPRPVRANDYQGRFSPKGGSSPAAASLLLLRARDIESDPGPNRYVCGNLDRHDTSPLRCSAEMPKPQCPPATHLR